MPFAACAVPATTCSFGNTNTGMCTLVDKPQSPPPAPATTAPQCVVSAELNTCSSTCVAQTSPNMLPPSCQATDPSVVCMNNCKKTFAACTAALSPSGSNPCAFVPSTGYDTCLSECRNAGASPVQTAPSPLPPRCSVSFDRSTCSTSCVATNLANTNVCQSNDPVVNCLNNCNLEFAQCSLSASITASTCSFVPTNATALDQCKTRCTAPRSPAVAPMPWSCFNTLDATKCSAVCIGGDMPPPAPTCTTNDALITCTNGCYRQFSQCASGVNGGCSFTPSTQLSTCLESCARPTAPVPVTAPAPVVPPTCQVAYDRTCTALCGTDLANTANCAPTDPVIRCKNACNLEFARCAATLAGTNTLSGCAFTPVNATLHRECLSRCVPASPVTVASSLPTTTCVLSASSSCESVCVVGTSTTPIRSCQPNDPVIACVNECKSAYATCKSLPGSNTGSISGCGLVPTDLAAYQGCVDQCRNVVLPPPNPTRCAATVDPASCKKVCGPATDVAPAAPTCTATTTVACLNRCQDLATCSLTNNGCAYVPTDALAYRECQSKCLFVDVPAPTVQQPQCMRTGCSGEICSSVPMMSDCSFTCHKACYRLATCAAVSTATSPNTASSCAWVMTQELETCLRACDANTVPQVAPSVQAPQCKITGCSRELCVPSTSPDPGCDALPPASCENRCLAYAQCSVLPNRLSNTGSEISCGWIPDPDNPTPYSECLTKCKQVNNPCIVSGCGSVCSTVASFRSCPPSVSCADRCNLAFNTCNLTASGSCAFLPTGELQRCLATCTDVPVVPAPPALCPPGVEASTCVADPCARASCPAFPNAVCRADRCGSCRAVFTVNGQVVNCDSGCANLKCSDCLAKRECAFCSGDVTATQQFGVCVAANSDATTRCLASRNQLLSSGATCPALSSGSDNTEVTDTTPFQNEVAGSNSAVRDKFIIVITLVVREQGTTELNLVRMFVDLIGTAIPDQTDRDMVCDVLKNALVKVDASVDGTRLTCALNEKVSVKRDVSYVADLSYPGGNNINRPSGASTLVVSVVALVAAVAAFVF